MDRRLIGEAQLARLALVASVGMSFLGGILVILQAALLSRIVARLFLRGAARGELAGPFLILVLVVGLRALNQAGIQISAAEVAIRVKQALRRRLVTHLSKLGPTYTRQERSGELVLTATDGIEALDAFFGNYLPDLLVAVLIPLAILLVVFPVDLLTFALLLITAPLIPIFMALIGSAAGGLARRRYAQLGRLSAHFLDVLQGLTTLKLFNRTKRQLATIAEISDRYRRGTMSVLRVAFLSAFALELVATISVAVVAVEIGLRLLFGRIPFEQALFLLVLAPEFYLPLRRLGASFHAGRDGAAAAERIFAMLDAPLTHAGGGGQVPAFTHIAFEDVTVSFSDRNHPALQSFSLTVAQGEHLALVGATGSGKSTVADLLLRFLEPDHGRIMLLHPAGDTQLNAVDTEAWRAQIAWVPQRGYLFNLSVADNIRIGRPDATMAQITAAARAANAHHFVCRLPAGYETELGENAVRLSGGQAQRIALARAFVRDAPIYIFDEATANLDDENEQLVQQNLKALTGGATVIIIAHRLATVTAADRIVVLDGGKIVEEGTHAQLIASQGAYFQLLQANSVDVHV